MSDPIPEELAKKLQSARNAASPVKKNGEAAEGYDFVRAEDVAEEARRLLKGRGIVVIPSVESVEMKVASKSGLLILAHLTFEIVLVKTGESITKSWIGSGIDNPGDKALYKAITGGTKYFYANLLGIPFGVDPEEGAAEVAESPPEEDVVEPVAIDPSRVSQVCAGINNSSLSTSDVVEMLTDLGVEVEEGTGVGRVVEAVKHLSPDQADQVEAHLERRAQDDAALAPDQEPAGVA